MPQPEGHLPQVVKKKEGHMPELRKRRSHLALLGVFAMVASVLAVGAPSALAEVGKADAEADFSACVGPATVDAGFTDVATGSTHDAAINCIAYYGITRGTTTTTFSPNLTITRWQLAVMLQRAAGPAGVTLPEAETQGFTDISGMSSAFQDAINQMAALGVMAGTTATTFNPAGIVSRAVIVEALAGFLTNARVGPGGAVLSRDINRTLTLKEDANSGAVTVNPDETFRDLGVVTFSAHQAIRALAEMGVVQGRGDGTFGPAASVTRAQAAAFITRALAHTNARPAGLTMQVENTAVPSNEDFELSISVRGNDFAPIDDAVVDVFYHTSTNANAAFKTDGTCNVGAAGVQAAGSGVGVCTIQLDDEVTESGGNVSVTPGQITENTVYWAWTADTGTRLDWDVTGNVSMDNATVSNAASVTMTTVTAADAAMVTTSVSSDAEGNNTVRYGTTVTVSIQIVDAQGNPLGMANQAYSWWAEGVHVPPTSQIPSTGSRVVTTDSTGKATFTLSQADPNTATSGPLAATNNNQTTWTYNIMKVPTSSGPDVAANSDIGFTLSDVTGTGSIVFDDDPGRALAVGIELGRPWTMRPATGGSARVAITGKVTDQYGSPLRNVPMFFDTSGDGQFGCVGISPAPCGGANTDIGSDGRIPGTTRRVTRSNGTNTITAAWDGATSAVYEVRANLSGTTDTDVADLPNEMATATHYWVQGPFGLDAQTGIAPDVGDVADVLYADLANNALIMANSWYPCDADPSDGCQAPFTGNAHGFNIGPFTYSTDSGGTFTASQGDYDTGEATENDGPTQGTFQRRGGQPAIPRVYTYTDNTLFQWYLGDTSTPANIRWIRTPEFERRMAEIIKDNNGSPDSLRVRFGVRTYNTKAGLYVISVRIPSGDSIRDPASG